MRTSTMGRSRGRSSPSAIATDEAEDEQHGDARGDELPEELRTDEGRRAWLERELAGERDGEHDDATSGQPRVRS